MKQKTHVHYYSNFFPITCSFDHLFFFFFLNFFSHDVIKLNMFEFLWLIFICVFSWSSGSSKDFHLHLSSMSHVGTATRSFVVGTTAFPRPCQQADSAFRTAPLRRQTHWLAETGGESFGQCFVLDHQLFSTRQQQRQKIGYRLGTRKPEPGRRQSIPGSWEQHCNPWVRVRRHRRQQQPSPA